MKQMRPNFRRLGWFVLLISGTCAAASEPLVVDIWPDKPARDVGISQSESSHLYDSSILGEKTKLITNVSRPTLTIVRPAKEKNTGTAMIVCPGGGYHNLFWDLEGVEVAEWLAANGMTGFILKYRCPRRPGDMKGEPPLGPLLDAQRAVRLIRSRAAEWNVNPQQIGIVGFSAGGDLAVRTATHFEQELYKPNDAIDRFSSRPDFAIGCYSGYFKEKDRDGISASRPVPKTTPPIFLAHASDDKISDPEHSAFMYLALKRAGVLAELHIFATGDHDFGARQNDKLPASWTKLGVRWLQAHGFAKPRGESP